MYLTQIKLKRKNVSVPRIELAKSASSKRNKEKKQSNKKILEKLINI